MRAELRKTSSSDLKDTDQVVSREVQDHVADHQIDDILPMWRPREVRPLPFGKGGDPETHKEEGLSSPQENKAKVATFMKEQELKKFHFKFKSGTDDLLFV